MNAEVKRIEGYLIEFFLELSLNEAKNTAVHLADKLINETGLPEDSVFDEVEEIYRLMASSILLDYAETKGNHLIDEVLK